MDIRTAEAFNLGGASDERLLDHCHKRGRVLLTNDDDLLRLAEKQAHAGIIFQTTQFLAPGELLWAMLRVIDTVTEDQVRGNVFYVP